MGIYRQAIIWIAVIAVLICVEEPKSMAQNLVPNASFESHNTLPCRLNEFRVQELLESWFAPTTGTTDYWSKLSPISCFLNPTNSGAEPRSGDGMIGIILKTEEISGRNNYREYAMVELNQALEKGGFYSLEFHALQLEKEISSTDIMASNNLGGAFSTSLINITDLSVSILSLKPKVEKLVAIGNGWQRISGCFIADSAYLYLVLGNFKKDNETESFRLTFRHEDAMAYYFIDDVKVEELSYDIAHLQQHMDFCFTDPFIELNASVEGATGYLWEDGTKSPVLEVSARENRDYPVRIFFNECEYEHTFRIRYISELELGPDTLLCIGEAMVLDPSHPIKEYSWSDGTSDTLKFISAPGQYKLSILSTSCLIEDSIDVSFIDCPGFTPNIITPNGDEFNQKLVFENIFNRVWSLQVFNRLGQLVYFSPSYANDWDGGDLSGGVYYYILYSTELGKSVKGWVQIVK
jgi:hypothetical protein